MGKEHPGNGNYSVNYDVFSCNGGVAPEAGMFWNTESGTWEWNDLSINPGTIPDNMSQEILMHWKIIFVLSVDVKTVHLSDKIKTIRN